MKRFINLRFWMSTCRFIKYPVYSLILFLYLYENHLCLSFVVIHTLYVDNVTNRHSKLCGLFVYKILSSFQVLDIEPKDGIYSFSTQFAFIRLFCIIISNLLSNFLSFFFISLNHFCFWTETSLVRLTILLSVLTNPIFPLCAYQL